MISKFKAQFFKQMNFLTIFLVDYIYKYKQHNVRLNRVINQ